ncbi:hypothetical protein BJY52DRAFT_1322012 [Lactarius psammicola]|nr:hypothetical protein BJY52DRAFT_1322012 [Lactarius psammicola]
MSGSGKSALVLGATGQVGRHVLREVLCSTHFTRVCEAGRRLTPLDSLDRLPDSVSARAKLEQRQIDFEKPEEWRDAFRAGRFDVVFIALATNMRDAKTYENFERVDKEYVLSAARAAKFEDSDKHTGQRLVYVSSGVANKDAYSQRQEQGLADLGYADTIIFRPGFLRNTNRAVFRPIEAVAGCVDVLGKSMCIAGERGTAALPTVVGARATNWGTGTGRDFTVITNSGAHALALEKS